MTRSLPTSFEVLRVRNFRLFFIGQAISQAGTFMQQVGQALLVLQLTGSGTALGLVLTLQLLPMVLIAPWAGVLSDRVNTRSLIMTTQAAQGCCALTLWLLVISGGVRMWAVYLLAALFGTAFTFDMPARQTFISEMVGHSGIRRAITLNQLLNNVGRAAGPAIATFVAVSFGLSACFLVNAISFVAVILALSLMRAAELHIRPTADRAARFTDGVAHVRETPGLCIPLLLGAVTGMFSMTFQVSLPLLAKDAFGNARAYGTISAVLGAGAIFGAIGLATRSGPQRQVSVAHSAVAFGGVLLALAVAPNAGFMFVATLLTGAGFITYTTASAVTVQMNADPLMRGRVMGLWSLAMVGTAAIGGPIVGFVGDTFGGRYGVAIGGFAATAAGLIAAPRLRTLDAQPRLRCSVS